jgi:predicted nucleotidyltransferase
MTTDEAALLVAKGLEAEAIPYIIVGGYSSNTYGIPRSTKDVDVVVSITASRLTDLLNRLGPAWKRDPQLSFETNTGTTREIFELKGTPLKVKIFSLSQDEHDQSRFARRTRKEMSGIPVWMPSPEDVVIWKLRWARPKDIEDVRNVLLVQSREGNLDWAYIREWCGKHGTLERFEEILAGLPKPKS